MLRRLKAKNIKVCLWINPYIAEASPLFAEGAAQGYLLKTVDGDVYQVDEWQPGCARVDFTNPDACAWYAGKLRALLDMGVDAFKTDFGERIPTNVRYFDGSDPERMHNYYTYLYNRTVFDLLREVKGEDEAVVFSRSATTGGQKFPVHWGGDNASTYPSMAETLRGGLSLGMCGFGFWSHDISGFIGTATPDLYKRWVAFGLLSSHSRLHGQRQRADALALRRRVDQRAAPLLNASSCTCALPVRCRPRGARPRLAGHAGVGPGIPGRSHLPLHGHAVHAGFGPAGRAGFRRQRRSHLLPAGRPVAPPADRRSRPGAGLAHRQI
jgi:alpha-glucosidase (family GH31 glycosyl hydrolase)